MSVYIHFHPGHGDVPGPTLGPYDSVVIDRLYLSTRGQGLAWMLKNDPLNHWHLADGESYPEFTITSQP